MSSRTRNLYVKSLTGHPTFWAIHTGEVGSRWRKSSAAMPAMTKTPCVLVVFIFVFVRGVAWRGRRGDVGDEEVVFGGVVVIVVGEHLRIGWCVRFVCV
jgi:hypothetical protein